MQASADKAIQKTPDVPLLLACARRQWWGCLVTGCVLAACGWAASSLIPARYKATARIRLCGPQGVVDRPHESSNAQREFRHTQKELLQTPSVIRRALDTPEVSVVSVIDASQDAAEEIADIIDVELPRSSEIMKVSLSHDDPEVAYVVVNAIVKSYLEEIRRTSLEDRDRKLKTLSRLHRESEEKLGDAWHELQLLASEIGSGDPAALSLQAQAEIENYRAYSRRLREVRSEKRDTERQIQAIKSESEILAEGMPEDASMHSVKFAMFTAKLKTAEALRNWGEGHPIAVAARGEEDLLREYYQKASRDNEKPRDRKEELIAEPLATLARLQHEELALDSLIGEIDERLQVLGGENSAKLEILRNEVARMERLSDRLWQTRENMEVERHADQRVQLVSLASLPQKRDTSKRSKLSLMMTAGGFGFGVLALAMSEFLTGRVHSPHESDVRTGLSMLGGSRALPSEVRTNTNAEMATSQLDMLVAEILCHPDVQHSRSFLVTSPETRGERGYFASHFAASLARVGKKTLHLSLDLRDVEHDVMEEELDEKRSRAPAWHGRAKLLDSPVETEEANLFRIPPIEPVEDPLPAIADESLQESLRILREQFAFIVIDAPSAARFPDALHIGRFAETALISVHKNESRVTSLRTARRKLESLKIPVLGVMAC